MATVNKEMIIADMLQVDPGIAPILMASGMHCIGCPSAQGESLEEAALVHGLDVDELINTVNKYLAKKAEAQSVQILYSNKNQENVFAFS